MSKATRVTIDGSYCKVKKMYVALDGTMRKIKKGYVIKENFKPCVGLPESYTQLEYVESDGSQYIDAGLNPSATDTRVVFQFQKTGTLACMLGSSAGAGQDALTITAANGVWVAGSGPHCTQSYSDGETYLMDVHAQDGTLSVTTNGTEQTDTYTGDMPVTASFYIFAQNQNGSAFQLSAMRLMYAKFYTDGVLQRDYVPCKDADGTVGLYDLVNGSFVSSAASTALTAGAAQGNVTRLVFDASPFESYSGAYTVSQVTDAEGNSCDLYTLTGSGTLVLKEAAEFWMCGGGGSGRYTGNGGGGGYIETGTLPAGTHVVTIGSGGSGSEDPVGNDGGSSAITTDGTVTASAEGGEYTGNGASGGGSGGNSSNTTEGTGAGASTYPFGIAALEAHSAGGGGGGYYDRVGSTGYIYGTNGGAGGTNGGDGGTRTYVEDRGGSGGAGGKKGGGAGGYCSKAGNSGAFYGAGGGGGGHTIGDGYNATTAKKAGGDGYQGVMYLLIPR